MANKNTSFVSFYVLQEYTLNFRLGLTEYLKYWKCSTIDIVHHKTVHQWYIVKHNI